MAADTIFRLYSMTKPITCVAFMTLFEEGLVRLNEPVAKYLPGFERLKVFAGDADDPYKTVDLDRPVTVWNLLTHTSGLSYPFFGYGPTEEFYRNRKVRTKKSLEGFIADLLEVPLAFQPGTAFRYSFSHDVIALLAEKISGMPFDELLNQRVLGPVRMVDTGFYVPSKNLPRFASMYGAGTVETHELLSDLWKSAQTGKNELLADARDSFESRPHNVFRGGSGLVSTITDYFRFCQMLLNKGELDGHRILGKKTVEFMTDNHLPEETLPYEMNGVPHPGKGYGLGFGVVTNVAKTMTLGSVGSYGWGGAASTYFWIDPAEEMIGIQMAQFQPNGFHPIREDFRVTAYQAIDK